MSDTFWAQLHTTRKLISQRESELADLYVQRAGLIQAMVASKMGQREIGAYWKISQPRVQGILKARGHR